MAQFEVLPVPAEMVPQFWRSACQCAFNKIPGYDIERTHLRLLAGVDQLWMAFDAQNKTQGVILTSISARPPQQRKAFLRKDPALMKSLTIHVAGKCNILSWLDSAIERINLYARQQGCRQLYILARKGWHTWLYRWYSQEWEVVALGRDRRTASTCKCLRARNTPGYFRLLIPIPAEKWNRCNYAFMSTCRFKEVA